MKKLLSFTAIIFGLMLTFAQAPEKFSYQAVIRNASNALITNTNVGMKISILKTSAVGTVVYAESQTAMTNINGLVSIQIGAGSVISGTIAGINWSNDSYYIKTETDPAGGTNYTIAGTTQLLSVPYALYSKNSGGGSGLTLPYAGTSSTDNVVPFKITNHSSTLNSAATFENTSAVNSEATVLGKNNSIEGNGIGVKGVTNSTADISLAAGVSGLLLGVNPYGAGVFGYANEASGVYGQTNRGIAIFGFAAGTGIGGKFSAPNGGTSLVVSGAPRLYDNNEGAGKVLTSDAVGNATWQDGITPFIHFSSTTGTNQVIVRNVETVINSWTGLEETGGSNYNASTGEYTIPVTGYYKMKANAGYLYPNTEDEDVSLVAILVNGNLIQYNSSGNAFKLKNYPDTSVSIEKKLNAGEKISVYVYQAGRASNELRKLATTFSVDLLHK